MKPLRLVMRAFGPYPGEEVIDFRPLGDGALFLICGSTGAGKSTIIDAMAFALYGEACSEDRDGRGSRSHLAPADRRTEVVFDFALGAERYRVVRRPEQERPKKKGSGVTVELHTAELWRRTKLAPGDDVLEGEVLAARWEAVNGKVVELLGFDCRQFRQVIVLPQGRFRELLTADSRAREEIFERLFRTSIYSTLQDRLRERARGIEKASGTLLTRREEVLRQAGADSAENLASQRAEAAGLLAAAAEERVRGEAALQAARAALEHARQAAAKWREVDDATRHHEAQRTAVAALGPVREELGLARQASPVLPFDRVVAGREAELAAAGRSVEAAEAALVAATARSEAARRGLAAEEAREPERERAVAAGVRLEGWREKVGALAELGKRTQAAYRRAEDAQRQAAAARRSLQAMDADLQTRAAQAERLAREAAEADSRAAIVAAVAREAALHAELRSGQREGDALEARHKQTRVARETAQERGAQAAERVAGLELAQREGRAALLAQTLADNAPCPVCGSPHHPRVATAEVAPPSDADLLAARTARDAADGMLARARDAEADAAQALARLRWQNEERARALGDLAAASVEAMQSRLDAARRDSAAATRARDGAAEAARALEGLRTDRERQAAALPAHEAEERRAADESRGLAALLAANEAEVPADLRTPEALDARIRQQERVRRELAAALEGARQRATEGTRAADAATGNRQRAAEALAGGERALDAARAELAAELARAGFSNVETLRAASRAPGTIQTLDDRLRAADTALASAADRLERARAAAAGLALPDLPAAESAHAAADQASREHIRLQAEREHRARALDGAAASLEAIEGELAGARRDYEVFGTLSEAANGNNGQRLTLQRYVLGALLDDVLVAATRRLLVMSRGRFQLLRQKVVSDGRLAGGLNLEVLDEYSGKTRPAGTLSGGEGFLAALSLALGLADVVQAHAGGVRMEAMFIDEGFGSLDPEALDHAFQALVDLQRGGRLVGIISHVEELKARIDCRLEIRTGRRGSTTRFVGVAE